MSDDEAAENDRAEWSEGEEAKKEGADGADQMSWYFFIYVIFVASLAFGIHTIVTNSNSPPSFA